MNNDPCDTCGNNAKRTRRYTCSADNFRLTMDTDCTVKNYFTTLHNVFPPFAFLYIIFVCFFIFISSFTGRLLSALSSLRCSVRIYRFWFGIAFFGGRLDGHKSLRLWPSDWIQVCIWMCYIGWHSAHTEGITRMIVGSFKSNSNQWSNAGCWSAVSYVMIINKYQSRNGWCRLAKPLQSPQMWQQRQ